MISVSEFIANGGDMTKVSIADVDKKLLTTDFQQGFIARNPKNHEDLWYVAKKYFDDNLQPAFDITINLTFGQAIEAAKQGKRIARQGWNGKGMFAYIVPAAFYLPQTGAAKQHFGENSLVPYRAYWALKTVQEDIATWTPSGSDTLAEDWLILN